MTSDAVATHGSRGYNSPTTRLYRTAVRSRVVPPLSLPLHGNSTASLLCCGHAGQQVADHGALWLFTALLNWVRPTLLFVELKCGPKGLANLNRVSRAPGRRGRPGPLWRRRCFQGRHNFFVRVSKIITVTSQPINIYILHSSIQIYRDWH